MMENRAFNEMLKAAVNRLEGRDPIEIARKSGMDFDEAASAFRFFTLGREISVSYPDYSFDVPLGEWHKLVILHYMDFADGCPKLGGTISFARLRNGMIRGDGFDRDGARVLSRIAGGKDEQQLKRMFERIGGNVVPSRADISAEIAFLPNYPVTINLYLADDEFSADGRMLLDESADHYLSVEDAVTVGMIILEALEASV